MGEKPKCVMCGAVLNAASAKLPGPALCSLHRRRGLTADDYCKNGHLKADWWRKHRQECGKCATEREMERRRRRREEDDQGSTT